MVGRQEYHLFRVNKAFARLIERRRTGLLFKRPEITQRLFFNILQKSAPQIDTLIIAAHLKFIKRREFEKMMIRPRCLIILDLAKFDNINETTLGRLIDPSSRTLKVFKVSYRNEGLGALSLTRLATCKNLNVVEFGQPRDFMTKIPFANLSAVKTFLRKKQSSLSSLKLYDCDEETLQILAEGPETISLEELSIVSFR